MSAPSEVADIIENNFHVIKFSVNGYVFISINHLKYIGESEYKVCRWEINENSVCVIEGNNCPHSEIVFVVKTIHKLGYQVDHIVYDSSMKSGKVDVSDQFIKYLHG